MLPVDRPSLSQWCLRKLGHPVINIEVSPDQIDDRIDEALLLYNDYHYNATEKVYYKYQIQPADITNGYITLPPNIIGAVDVLNYDPMLNSSDLFSYRYQVLLNDLWNTQGISLAPYYMTFQNLGFIHDILVGLTAFRYNRLNNLFYIDIDWTTVTAGQYFVIVAYQVIDPTVYPSLWKDRWLMLYTTALIKRNWGENLSKFQNVQLVGGNTLNASEILSDAINELSKLEVLLRKAYSEPAGPFFIG